MENVDRYKLEMTDSHFSPDKLPLYVEDEEKIRPGF
jgi:hypothetical protein